MTCTPKHAMPIPMIAPDQCVPAFEMQNPYMSRPA